METRIFILSLACFSCLVPPALSAPAPLVLTKALAAVGALKGAAVLGAGALAAAAAKGAIVKGLAAKGALIGLGAKALKAKVASLGLPRPTFVRPPLVLEKPVMIQPVPYPVPPPPAVVLNPPSLSNIVDKLGGLVNVSKEAVAKKTAAVGELLSAMLPTKEIVVPPQPVVYEVVTPPKFFPLPMVESIVMK